MRGASFNTDQIFLRRAVRASFHTRAPAKAIPDLPLSTITVADLQSSPDGDWSTTHSIVGELAAVRLPPPPAVAALGAPAPRPRRQRPKPTVVTVAAAFTAAGDSAPSQFLASVLSDSSHTVVFTSAQQLSEAIFARSSHVLRTSHATGSREARRLYCRLQLGDDVTGDEVMVPQAAADNIATAARRFGAALPTDAAELLGPGFRVQPKEIPRPTRRAYRTVLSTVWATALAADDASDDTEAVLWRAALCFDSYVLAPPALANPSLPL